jgi:molybdate transport system substrate-binding protein
MRLRQPFPNSIGLAGLVLALAACAPGIRDYSSPQTTVAATVGIPANATTGPVTLNVFAAASLTDAFKEIGAAFAAEHAGVTPQFNFAGSQQLVAQIHDGAAADVFASANKKQMDAAVTASDVVSGTQRTFARNRLVVVYPKDNPAGLQGLADLGKPGTKVVLAAKAVPVGGYALEFLQKASEHSDFTPAYSATVMANVVSFEDDVLGVLGKVAQGEADAGVVYSSDITGANGAKVGTLDIPVDLNVLAAYPIAPVAHAQHAELARDFVDYVLSPAGQAVLVKHGFLPAGSSAR